MDYGIQENRTSPTTSTLQAHTDEAGEESNEGDKRRPHEDVEEGSRQRQSVPYFKVFLDQGYVDAVVLKHQYSGSGSEEDPFLVEWLDSDLRNPLQFSNGRKWLYVAIESMATFAVAMTTSIYSAGPKEVIGRFDMSREVYEFGFSGLCSMTDKMQTFG